MRYHVQPLQSTQLRCPINADRTRFANNRAYGLVQTRRRDCLALIVTCVFLLTALGALPTRAQETTANPALDQAFKKLAALELGQDLQAFAPIYQAVAQAHSDPRVRADLESRLIGMLQSDATDLAKDLACRELTLVGSDASIPALSQLLPNERLSSMARYALEGIGGSQATASLRDMLSQTQGRPRVGIVISLGRMADDQAAELLAALLTNDDRELREAVIIALGRIGNVAAADALRQFAATAPDDLRDTVTNALLSAGGSLSRKGEFEAATECYQALESSTDERVRAAAFRGLIGAMPTESAAMILAGLASDEPWKRAVAADCLCGVLRPDELGVIASSIAQLPDAGQLAALGSLQSRRESVVRDAALAALSHMNRDIRLAALSALRASATAEDVARLAQLACTASDPTEGEAAMDTLRLMSAAGTNEALLAVIRRNDNPHPVLIRCALARRTPEFTPVFLQAAESSNADTRLAALQALEIMSTAQEIEPLIRLLCHSDPGAEREAADRAVWMSCQQIADPVQRAAPLLAALRAADKQQRCAILPSLARLGGEEALATVHQAMQDPDQAIQEAGYRALCNWPDDSVADELLQIAKTADVPAYRIWALRAYARLVTLPSQRSPQETFTLLRQTLDLATRAEDRALIVTRLGTVRTPEALDLLLTFLDQSDMRSAAIPAVFELAKGLSQSHPDQANAALTRILEMTDDPALRQQIPKVLRDIEVRQAGQNP